MWHGKNSIARKAQTWFVWIFSMNVFLVRVGGQVNSGQPAKPVRFFVAGFGFCGDTILTKVFSADY